MAWLGWKAGGGGWLWLRRGRPAAFQHLCLCLARALPTSPPSPHISSSPPVLSPTTPSLQGENTSKRQLGRHFGGRGLEALPSLLRSKLSVAHAHGDSGCVTWWVGGARHLIIIISKISLPSSSTHACHHSVASLNISCCVVFLSLPPLPPSLA